MTAQIWEASQVWVPNKLQCLNNSLRSSIFKSSTFVLVFLEFCVNFYDKCGNFSLLSNLIFLLVFLKYFSTFEWSFSTYIGWNNAFKNLVFKKISAHMESLVHLVVPIALLHDLAHLISLIAHMNNVSMLLF